jgi:hypothetical protein
MAESAKVAGARQKAGPPLPVKAYLLLYNGALAAGWSVVLVRSVLYTLDHAPSWVEGGVPASLPGLYDNLRWPLQVFQTAAFMEILHVVMGMVRSGIFTTLLQVTTSRDLLSPIPHSLLYPISCRSRLVSSYCGV